MQQGITRRGLMVAGASSGAALWLPWSVREADAASLARVPVARGGRFMDGVLSGDPEPTAVTLWTRLADQALPRVRVRLEVATDEDFRNVVVDRYVPCARLRDHTVKARIGRLEPDKRYWYRFSTRTTESLVGRTQTAPALDSRRPVRIGYFSCQDFASGWYGAYQKLIEMEPDVVLCGGDYIYDRVYTDSGYGGIRVDDAGVGSDSIALTQQHYRAKYRLYRSDPDLRELHRLFPFVAQWDDHEVTDNYVGTLDKGTPDDGAPEDSFDRARILAGWRAFHEYQPALRFGKSYRTYRSLRLGRTAELFLLDCRAYRQDQPCDGGTFTSCPELSAPREYLGAEQLGWIKNGLAGSPSRWKIVGNQLMVMPFNVAASVQVEVDSWNGYHAERASFLTHIKDRAIKDVTFLTGDIHTFFAGNVRQFGTEGPDVATEFVCGSTTSPGTSQTLSQVASGGALPPDSLKPPLDLGIPIVNPWMAYAETRTHGVAVVDASDGDLRCRYLGSRALTSREASADVRVLADLRVARGVPRVEVAVRNP